MDGKYLASNIAPLKEIGDGKVFNAVNDLMNSNQFKNAELAAYSINGSDNRIVTCEFLFSRTDRRTLYFRTFDFYKATGTVDDVLKLTADFGVGLADTDLERFLRLRDFYSKENEVECKHEESETLDIPGTLEGITVCHNCGSEL